MFPGRLQMFLYTCSELSGKELVAEMVYSFLLPEVEKETMRRKGKNYNCVAYFCVNVIIQISLTPPPLSPPPPLPPSLLVHHGQRRHLLAAHKIIHGEIEKMASESTSVAREEDKLEASTTADDTDSTA